MYAMTTDFNIHSTNIIGNAICVLILLKIKMYNLSHRRHCAHATHIQTYLHGQVISPLHANRFYSLEFCMCDGYVNKL